MLKSSIKKMTMSVVCIVMCLIVTTAFANHLPFSQQSYFTSAHNPGNAVRAGHRPPQKRYNDDACDASCCYGDSMEGCTITIDPNDTCRQWTECTRSSGNLWNGADLCKAAIWSTYKALTSRWSLTSMNSESARAGIIVSVFDNDPSQSSSVSYHNILVVFGFEEVSRFLKYQNLTVTSFKVDVSLNNCARFRSSLQLQG